MHEIQLDTLSLCAPILSTIVVFVLDGKNVYVDLDQDCAESAEYLRSRRRVNIYNKYLKYLNVNK